MIFVNPDPLPLLCIQQLSVSYASPEGRIAAVNDFSLNIQPGECVGVVGESGAGKSQSWHVVRSRS